MARDGWEVSRRLRERCGVARRSPTRLSQAGCQGTQASSPHCQLTQLGAEQMVPKNKARHSGHWADGDTGGVLSKGPGRPSRLNLS